MADDHLIFVIGGARSGKSAFALQQGLSWHGDVCFVATAAAIDEDMDRRIERHRDERPAHWGLIEEQVDLPAAVGRASADASTLLIVDCLTVWTSNLMFAGTSEEPLLEAANSLAAALQSREGPSIVVSNEVGLGVHPETELGRTYRDQLGRVNQVVASAADRTLFFAAGLAFELGDPSALLAR